MEEKASSDQPEKTPNVIVAQDKSESDVLVTYVEISNVSSEDAITTVDFEKCTSKDGGGGDCVCLKCKDFVILDDTDFEKNSKNDSSKEQISELTPFTPTSSSFSTSTPRKDGVCNAKLTETGDRGDYKCQPTKVDVDENEKKEENDNPVRSGNDKNTENDSLIITADEIELDNEIETKDKETDNGPTKKENETAVTATVAKETKKSSNTNKQESETKTTAPPKQTKDTNNKNETAKPPTKSVLWVTNVNRTIKASDLKRHFCKFGKVIAAKIVTDGKRCFGHITLQKFQDLENCVKYLNNTYFEGKKITVSTSPPEKNFESEYAELKTPAAEVDKKVKETKKRIMVEDPLTTKFPVNDGKQPEKRSKSNCNHEKLQKENERLRRHLRDEEMKIKEERSKIKAKDEALREMDFKLKQERHKLKMERELFEKERQEVFRLDQERRKLEEEKLELLRYKSKVEEELRVKKRKLTKEFVRSRSEEKQKSVKSKIGESHLSKSSGGYGVKSRLRSRSRSRGKIEDGYYRREREENSKHFMRPPPAPKLSEIERSKHSYPPERFSGEKKYYGEKRSPDRKYDEYRYPVKKSIPERRLKTHREGKSSSDRFGAPPYEASPCDQWKQNVSPPPLQKINEGWPQVNNMEPWKASGPNQPLGMPSNGSRYQDSSFPFQFGGGSSRSWYPAPPGTDFSRYEHYSQPPLSRKY